MIVRTPGNDAQTVGFDSFGQGAGVLNNALGVVLEIRTQSFAERDGLRRNHMHQRPTLHPGEDRHVEWLGQVVVIPKDHAGARTTQALVSGCRHDMGMGEGRGMRAASDQSGNVAHIYHEIRADLVGHLAESLPVPDAGIGRSACNDELRLVGFGNRHNLIHVDQFIVLPNTVADRIEPLAAHVDRRTMGQVAARI